MKTFEYELEEKRKPLDYIVENSAAILEELIEKLLESYNTPAAALMVKTILKIFYAAINVRLVISEPINLLKLSIRSSNCQIISSQIKQG